MPTECALRVIQFLNFSSGAVQFTVMQEWRAHFWRYRAKWLMARSQTQTDLLLLQQRSQVRLQALAIKVLSNCFLKF